MTFGTEHRISDICLLVEDIQRTVDFYVDRLGFRLRRRAEGFADFHGEGVTLAAWEIGHISRHTGVSDVRAPRAAHKACVAVRLDAPAEIDRVHAALSAKGVPFQGPPADYVWNARCAYFTDPDGTLWELYAWLDGGPGDYHDEQP
ncbi:VOC family protein [Aquibium microcysteis]|uniref:VOC family protein n=1 Tax=Aquibium microcysteis TaxID=675281 RepID=UPI00165D1B5D|nr:VOC family protein [Aquibium microcysteis]